MKRIVNVFLLFGLLAMSYNLTAQKAKIEGKETKPAGSAASSIKAYLGDSGMTGGLITKPDFDRYLKQGIRAKDSVGNSFRVSSFTFSYGERNLYEDSLGNLMVLTDYLSEFCPGDTVTLAVTNNIYYKTKPGDTAYIDNVKVLSPEGRQMLARSMRFVLTK